MIEMEEETLKIEFMKCIQKSGLMDTIREELRYAMQCMSKEENMASRVEWNDDHKLIFILIKDFLEFYRLRQTAIVFERESNMPKDYKELNGNETVKNKLQEIGKEDLLNDKQPMLLTLLRDYFSSTKINTGNGFIAKNKNPIVSINNKTNSFGPSDKIEKDADPSEETETSNFSQTAARDSAFYPIETKINRIEYPENEKNERKGPLTPIPTDEINNSAVEEDKCEEAEEDQQCISVEKSEETYDYEECVEESDNSVDEETEDRNFQGGKEETIQNVCNESSKQVEENLNATQDTMHEAFSSERQQMASTVVHDVDEQKNIFAPSSETEVKEQNMVEPAEAAEKRTDNIFTGYNYVEDAELPEIEAVSKNGSNVLFEGFDHVEDAELPDISADSYDDLNKYDYIEEVEPPEEAINHFQNYDYVEAAEKP